MSETAADMLHAMRKLVWLETSDSDFSLNCLLEISRKYGASNYLSYKLAYIRSAKELSTSALATIAQIEEEIGHPENVSMHFSALENLSSKVSLFGVVQRRVSGLVGRVGSDFRRAMSLSNFIPTPLDESDISGFLLRATESSLLDTLYSVLIIFSLTDRFDTVVREFKLCLNPSLVELIEDLLLYARQPSCGNVVTSQYVSKNDSTDTSLDIYRISSAFLERENFSKYRNDVDRVIGARLLSEIVGEKKFSDAKPFDDKSLLLGGEVSIMEGLPLSQPDTFYRTYLFLKFIEDKTNLALLSGEDIKSIFENTLRLDVLLTEDEINTLYLTASDENKSLIAVLALALYRTKSIDPDVDFEFRSDFIDYVCSRHNGSILDFINFLLEDSPDIANYVVASLDEVTLEKMYTLVNNSSQASEIRGDILRTIGESLNRIEYIIEADAITTRSKLSKLQKYFDSSRMYVDSVAMKKWLDSNPTIATEQYRSLYPKIQALVAAVEVEGGEYLLSQIVKDAFEQFCLTHRIWYPILPGASNSAQYLGWGNNGYC